MIFSFSLNFSQIIPSDNRIAWTPGIPSGEQNIHAGLIVNVVEQFGADNSGNSDVLKAIDDAIFSVASTGGVIFFPKGTYRINGTIKISNDKIILRGEGADKTKLHFYNPINACIEIITYGRGIWQGVNGYAKDTTILTVENGSAFTVGDFAEIQQDNDTNFMYTKPLWNQPWAQKVVGQFMQVVAIDGNEITLKTPLHITYQSEFNPQIRPQQLLRNVNIEELYIELKTDSDVSTINYKNAAYGLVKNIESYHTKKAHVSSESTIGCEVRNSKFTRSFDYGGGGHGYGVALGFHTTDWLVENNIFDSLRHALIFSTGANGNVISYNFSQNVLQGSGESNLNQGWNPPDISNHGHYAYMNLIEGNSVQEVGISDYWGPTGPGNVYFRNRVLIEETQDGIWYNDVTVKQNVIGNSAIIIKDVGGKASNNLEHGNLINGQLFWDNSITDHNLPNSYYLQSKPAFFESTDWPLYGPTEGFSRKLPAQKKFESSILSVTTSSPLGLVEYYLFQNYPNPFNSGTIISYTISKSEFVSIKLYDSLGRLVKVLTSGIKSGGNHSIHINTENLSSGMYYYQLASEKFIQIKKMILLK
ncbi:MAG: glycosyl hydrolase family 28-related protein [Melioribacteraceae bacterium]